MYLDHQHQRKRSFHTETKPAPAAGREREDKAALSLGETLTPVRLRAFRVFRAECVWIVSLLDTNNGAGPGGQTCSSSGT